MNPAAPHRVGLTLLVGLAAVVVVAGVVAGSPVLERIMLRLPAVPTTDIALGLAAIGLLALAVWGIAALGRAARTRARGLALASTLRGELSCGIRSRLLLQRMNELTLDDAHEVTLDARYSIVVDELGIAFWNGGARPRRAIQFPWREVRNIRSDSMVVGGSVVHVLVLRIRHGGASVELPIILSAGRAGRFALADAPFFGVVRSWKAKHRAALAAAGLELPPLTAPISIIRPEAAAAARR